MFEILIIPSALRELVLSMFGGGEFMPSSSNEPYLMISLEESSTLNTPQHSRSHLQGTSLH
jgi:hypothetical protein